MLGALQAEELTGMLEGKSLELPWNKLFSGSPVMIKEGEKLPGVELAGGMTFTLLSPTAKQLVDLMPEWKKTCSFPNDELIQS
ncbi:MAG: internalization-related competence protein ComEC/Rec2 [Candidatus Brocadiaceae bacterium]|nr:internalization-related competence protein ComEC/Rec2 [Candidatus Brocadiaceae bacterium]